MATSSRNGPAQPKSAVRATGKGGKANGSIKSNSHNMSTPVSPPSTTSVLGLTLSPGKTSSNPMQAHCMSCHAKSAALSTLQPCMHQLCGPCVGDMLSSISVDATETKCPSPVCNSAVARIVPPTAAVEARPRKDSVAGSPTSPAANGRRFSDAVKANGGRRDSQASSIGTRKSSTSSESPPRASDSFFSPQLSIASNLTSPASGPRLTPLVKPPVSAPIATAPLSGIPTTTLPTGQSIVFPTICPWSVIRLENVPWVISVDNVKDFLSLGSRPIENVLPSPSVHALSIHILCDRYDGRTADSAYVEVVDEATARRLARELKGQRVLNRVVGVHISSQQELMAALFPSSILVPSPFNRPAQAVVVVSAQELQGILELCQLSSAHAIKCIERPFYQLVSILCKVPWHDPSVSETDVRAVVINSLHIALRQLILKSETYADWQRIAELMVHAICLSPAAYPAEQDSFRQLLKHAIISHMQGNIRAAIEASSPTSAQHALSHSPVQSQHLLPRPPTQPQHLGPRVPSPAVQYSKAVGTPVLPPPRMSLSVRGSSSALPGHTMWSTLPKSLDALALRDQAGTPKAYNGAFDPFAVRRGSTPAF